jgi:hypothetical protein
MYGGIDAYLIKTPNSKLNIKMIRVKKKIINKIRNIY